jgi:hypothetical protein
VLSELKKYVVEWPEVVNMVQSFLNNSLSTWLNNKTPIQTFTGHAAMILLALMLKDNVPVNAPLDFIRAQNLMKLEKLSSALTEIHALVAEKTSRDRKAAIQKLTDKTHVGSPNNQVGDYVLVAEHRKSGTYRLQVRWKGPRGVASVEFDNVFVVENVLTEKLKGAHIKRLRIYQDKDPNITAEKEMFHGLLVAWRGFPFKRSPVNLAQLWLWMFQIW